MGRENLGSGGKEEVERDLANVGVNFSFEQKWEGKREKERDENGQLDVGNVERRSGVVSVVFLRILRRGKG